MLYSTTEKRERERERKYFFDFFATWSVERRLKEFREIIRVNPESED